MTCEEAQKILEPAVERLGEHFDAVQILVSWGADGGGTHCSMRGCGNWYARQGMAHKFITDDVADENAQRIGKAISPPDDGEAWKG